VFEGQPPKNKTRWLLTAMALPVAYYRVGALSVPAIDLPDRRTAEQRVTRWALLRDLEAVLYGSINTSTGAVHRLMGRESL
jgi:hypothetical protein